MNNIKQIAQKIFLVILVLFLGLHPTALNAQESQDQNLTQDIYYIGFIGDSTTTGHVQ